MDLNHRPLELEETAIPTEPQPLPLLVTLFDAAATLERNKFVFSSSHVVRPVWAIF